MLNLLKPLKGLRGERKCKHWPTRVLDILETKYHLLPKDLLRLGYIRRRLSAGKFSMDYIYIYDRTTSWEKNLSISSYQDISKNNRLLLFKGNIYPDGSVRLEKVRAAAPQIDDALVARQ
jgi:hypothetical protein